MLIKKGGFIGMRLSNIIKIVLFTLSFYIIFIAYETYSTKMTTPPTTQTAKNNKQPLWVYSLNGKSINHIIIGDSFVQNIYNHFPFGFASLINDELEETTKKTILSHVYNQETDTIEEVFHKVQSEKILKLVPKADVITISSGMEDFLPLLEEYNQSFETSSYMDQIKNMYFENLQMLIEMIRSQNPFTLIILNEIYFPLWFDETAYPETSTFVDSWNSELQELSDVYEPMIITPLNDMFTKNSQHTWTLNGTYPNDTGIELIGEWTLKEIISTPIPKPVVNSSNSNYEPY